MDVSSSVAALPRSMVFPVDAVPIGASHYVIDGVVAAHRHMFVEIAVVLGGSGEHCAETGSHMARPGDVFVIHPGVWHAYQGCQQCAIVNCYFGAELLDRELAWMRQDALVAPLLRVVVEDHPVARLSSAGCDQYRRLIDQLIERTQHVRAAMRVECLGLLTALLGVLAEALEPASFEKERTQHPAVAAAQRMLEQQLDYPWRLVELAYQLHIDRSYLVRLFRQQTGLAPMAFLAQRRAERAALLLRTTAQPVSAIGSAVGWHDLNQFNRRFKAVFGVSASVYRMRF